MADTTNRLAGIAYLSIDGQRYMLAGDGTYDPSLTEKEKLVGQDAPHGYTEKPVFGSIGGTLRDAGDLSVQSINQMTNVSMSLELANGKTVVGRNMCCESVQEVNTQEATFAVKFFGFVEEA